MTYHEPRPEPPKPEGYWGTGMSRSEYYDWKRKMRERYEREAMKQVYGGIQPQPRYRPEFYGMTGELGGSQYYLDYFQSMFPSFVHEFEATLPTYKGFKSAWAAQKEAEKIQETWADWLKKKRPEAHERFWGMRPERRGEKPWAYQPGIRTRGF